MIAQDSETGRGMSDDELRDQVMTLMLAGHDVSVVVALCTISGSSSYGVLVVVVTVVVCTFVFRMFKFTL